MCFCAVIKCALISVKCKNEIIKNELKISLRSFKIPIKVHLCQFSYTFMHSIPLTSFFKFECGVKK